MALDLLTPDRPAQPDPAPRALRRPVQPPPMREVTKGWFTMHEEAKTMEQLRKDDLQRK